MSTMHHRIRLFRDGHDQALRIPRSLEFHDEEVIVHREGNRLIVEPVPRHKRDLREILGTLEPLDEDFPEVEDPPVQDEDFF